MNSEYVKLSSSEKVYGQKNLLNGQLEILNITRSFQIYSLLRKEELLLKVALKNKIQELHDSLDVFEKILPKTSFKTDDSGEVVKPEKKKSKEDVELEREIAEVRKKIENLSNTLSI